MALPLRLADSQRHARTTMERKSQRTRYHPADGAGPATRFPRIARECGREASSDLAGPCVLLRRVSLWAARALRPRLPKPLFAVQLAGAKKIHQDALRD